MGWRSKLSHIPPSITAFSPFYQEHICSSSSAGLWYVIFSKNNGPSEFSTYPFPLQTPQTTAFDTMSSRLKQGDTSLLAEMHATTSGLKVYISSNGVQDLETARRSMGGHGYSAFAGLGRLYADYLPSVTYVLASLSTFSLPVSCIALMM